MQPKKILGKILKWTKVPVGDFDGPLGDFDADYKCFLRCVIDFV